MKISFEHISTAFIYAIGSAASAKTRLRDLETITENVDVFEQYFQHRLNWNFARLNTPGLRIGFAPVKPWTGSSLPTWRDSANWRYNPTEATAVEKYASAYGIDPQLLADSISQHTGVDSVSYNPVCTSMQDCSNVPGLSMCGIREGRPSGYCIADWAGSCDNLALASVSEPEPICPVMVNNVLFRPFDIKILLTLLYKDLQVNTISAGQRNDDFSAPQVDISGRPMALSFRDVNPGLFHVLLINILIDFKSPLIVDTLANGQVMNAPIRDFKVMEIKQVDPAYIAANFFNSQYTFNPSMRYLYYVKTLVNYVYAQEEALKAIPEMLDANSHSWIYEYYLEVNEGGNVVGGSWHGNSIINHPDIVWLAKMVDLRGMVSTDGIAYENLKALLKASVSCVGAL